MEEVASPVSKPPVLSKAGTKDLFLLVMGIMALVIVVAGFVPTYVAPMINGNFVAKPFVHLHGLIYRQPFHGCSGISGSKMS